MSLYLVFGTDFLYVWKNLWSGGFWNIKFRIRNIFIGKQKYSIILTAHVIIWQFSCVRIFCSISGHNPYVLFLIFSSCAEQKEENTVLLNFSYFSFAYVANAYKLLIQKGFKIYYSFQRIHSLHYIILFECEITAELLMQISA